MDKTQPTEANIRTKCITPMLIDGRTPSDDQIAQELRENWHPSKRRFTPAELKTWLAWLPQHALAPQGKGPHTVGQQGKLQLH